MARPTDYNENMFTNAQEYLAKAHDFIDDTGKMRVRIPKVEGLAVHLGVARSTIYLWANEHSEFSDILERIGAMQADRVIDRAMEGTYNATIAKLLLTKHGYSDKQELLGKDGEALNVGVVMLPVKNNENTLETPNETDSGTI